MDTNKKIFLQLNETFRNLDMSKLDYADTLAFLKKRSLKTAEHCEMIKRDKQTRT